MLLHAAACPPWRATLLPNRRQQPGAALCMRLLVAAQARKASAGQRGSWIGSAGQGCTCSARCAACSSPESVPARASASAALNTAASVALDALSSCSSSAALPDPPPACRGVWAWRGLIWLPASQRCPGQQRADQCCPAHERSDTIGACRLHADVGFSCALRLCCSPGLRVCSPIKPCIAGEAKTHLISSLRPAAGQWRPGAPSPQSPAA
jgi:hypothetical protein